MNLVEIREQVGRISGRYDLVDPSTWADEGMDFYITAAQKYLDLKTDHIPAKQEVEVDLDAGEHSFTLPRFRAPEMVWVRLSSGFEYPLRDVLWNDLKSAVGAGGGLSVMDRGNPTVYALAPVRSSPPTEESETYKGITIAPAPQGDITVVVQGLTYSAALEENDDISFWSVAHPDLLVLATLMQLEIFYRNSQGRNDYGVQVEEMLTLIEWDSIRAQIANVHSMADSW